MTGMLLLLKQSNNVFNNLRNNGSRCCNKEENSIYRNLDSRAKKPYSKTL